MDMERELRDLIARRDISKAIHAYMRGQDRLDHALQLSAFHPDADVDCGLLRGDAKAYTDFAQGFLANLEGSQHILGQIDMDIDCDAGTGRGEVYFFAWHRLLEDGVSYDLIMAGRYIDEYSFEDRRWAIKRRRELIDWARKDSASDDMLREMTQIHLSGRNGNDFSQTRDWASGISGR
ncbi:MAG: nuclear transport factor 2 family protein [Sphingomonadales bacterium]|nr:MAG: nuclear transport factor 2 family protein [Sphingomonadales bacterium]TNF04772.1 MAG: nuclear transport factor 2 family protein [Sphingomonadales bacterium]